MKIAIDISPLHTGHKIRGVGFYLSHLKKALVDYFSEHTYSFFTNNNEIPKDIDIIHYPYFDPFFVTLPFLRSETTVVTVHDLTPIVLADKFPSGIKGKLKWELQRQLLKKVDGIITDSESSKKDIVRLIGIPEEKVSVVYLAAGEEFRILSEEELQKKELLAKYNLPEKFVLYVGDITPNKNIPALVEACLNYNLPLVLVGKSIAEEDYDKTNAWNADRIKVEKMLEGQKNIYRLGFVDSDDLVRIYNIATVFTMPSLYEGFGLPVLEAMACGTPVVTSQGGSLKEVAGDAALFIDPYNVESIGLGIKKVFEDVTSQEKLKKKGLENIKKYSWKKSAQETIQTYSKVKNNI